MRKITITFSLLFLGINIYSQEIKPTFVTLNNNNQISDAEEVKSDGLQVFAIRVLDVPELSKYDLVTGILTFPDDRNVKYPAFYQLTGTEMMASAKNSTKTQGMKYIQFVVTTATDGKNNGAGFFLIDAYPFALLDIPYLFSKQGNSNQASYTMEFELTGQMIISYDEKWEDGILKKIPVYGNHIPLTTKISIAIVTSSYIGGKGVNKEVSSPDDLKGLFGK